MINSDVRLADVKTVVAMPGREEQSGVRAALHQSGIRGIVSCDEIDSLADVLAKLSPALVICDLLFPADEVFDIAQLVRMGLTACPPHALFVAVTDDTDPDPIRQAVAAGFDDVILKPLSIGLLSERLQHLAEHRKPFVVCAEYIGPERRTEGAVSWKRTKVPTVLDAPNPLRPDAKDLEAAKRIVAAVKSVRAERRSWLDGNAAAATGARL